jgi:hypothetical protein
MGFRISNLYNQPFTGFILQDFGRQGRPYRATDAMDAMTTNAAQGLEELCTLTRTG